MAVMEILIDPDSEEFPSTVAEKRSGTSDGERDVQTSDGYRKKNFGGAERNRTADKGFADPCLTTWRRRRCGLVRLGRAVLDFATQDDRLGDVFHWPILLLTLALKGQIGLLRAQSQFTLQDAFASFHQLAGFQFQHKCGIMFLQLQHSELGSENVADAGQ